MNSPYPYNQPLTKGANIETICNRKWKRIGLLKKQYQFIKR